MKTANLILFILFLSTVAYADEKPNVTISGKLYQTTSSIGIIVDEDCFVFQNNHIYMCKINPDSTFTVRFYLPSSQMIKVINQPVFAEPGDSICVTITGKGPFPKMSFDGAKAYQYNFFPNLRDVLAAHREETSAMSQYPDTPEGLEPFKAKLFSKYLEKKVIIDSYCRKYPVSKNFSDYIYAECYFEYLNKLLDKYKSVVKNSKVDQMASNLYFKGINLKNIKNDNYINSGQYINFLYRYIIGYLSISGSYQVPGDQLKPCVSLIENDLKGKTRDIILGMVFVSYFNKGDQTFKESLLNLYRLSKKYFYNSQDWDKLTPFYNKYLSYNYNLTEDLSTQILSIDKKTQTLGKFVADHSGTVIYIDLWASWCSPCRAEMPYSRELASSYTGKNIKFIYLSVDADKTAWLKAFDELQMSSEISFWMDKNLKSAFAQKIALSSIPRYLIIDKKGHIVVATAPRPSDDSLKAMLDKFIVE